MRFLTVLVFASVVVRNAYGQAEDPAQHPGKLRPIENTSGAAPAWVTPPLKAEAAANVKQLVAAVTRSSALTAPVGYDVVLRWSANFQGRKEPINGTVLGILFEYYRDDDGKLEVGHEGYSFGISVNAPLPCAFDDYKSPFMEDSVGRVFIEPQPDSVDHGYQRYAHPPLGGCVLMTKITRPLWLPVSRERVVNHMIAEQQKGLDEWKAMVGRLESQLHVKPTADQLQQYNETRAHVDRLRAKLAALTPAERAGQAYMSLEPEDGGTAIVGAGTPRSIGLVMLNPEYFDKTAPVTAIQTLSLRIQIPPTEQWHTPTKEKVIRRIHDEMDWSLLEALLK